MSNTDPNQLGYAEALAELDSILRDLERPDVDVDVLATIADRAELDRVLTGWERVAEEPDGVAWLRERLSGA